MSCTQIYELLDQIYKNKVGEIRTTEGMAWPDDGKQMQGCDEAWEVRKRLNGGDRGSNRSGPGGEGGTKRLQ